MKIKITAGEVSLAAKLNNSPTAQQIWQSLPIEGRANIWGDEIFFEIPVMASRAADARVEMDVGELGYWPVGHAFCIFFGPTPVSIDAQPRAYSPVNVVGRVVGDATRLKVVPHGAVIHLEEA